MILTIPVLHNLESCTGQTNKLQRQDNTAYTFELLLSRPVCDLVIAL